MSNRTPYDHPNPITNAAERAAMTPEDRHAEDVDPARLSTLRLGSIRVEFEYVTDDDGSFVRARWCHDTGYRGIPSAVVGPFMRTRLAALRAIFTALAARPEVLLGIDGDALARMREPA